MIMTKRVLTGTIKPVEPFATLEEEANYWDNRSVTDELEEGAAFRLHRPEKTDSLTIRFTRSDIDQLRDEAGHKGIGPSTLARMWILERLKGGRHSST